MKPLRLMTLVWGQNHTDWFERACARSLAWPKNNAALRSATWNIFSKKEDAKRVLEIAMTVRPKEIVYHELPEQLQGNDPAMGHFMLQVLLGMIDLCLKDGSQMITAPPDTIFSDGTIPTLLKLGAHGDTCVAVPHPRVSPSIFGSLKEGALTGPQLVSRAMKHGHRSWTHSEIGSDTSCSFVGGVSWEKLDDGLYSVTHRLPTVYLANFVRSDFNFFQQPHGGYDPVYGLWDHAWPAVLLKNQRLRWPGSSDAACIVEVTKEDLNVPPIMQSNPHEPDAFWRSEHHNQILRQVQYIMRGE